MAGRNYFKSPEGVAEYKKLGLEYPTEMYDEDYERFLHLTSKTDKKDRKMRIGNMKRFILATGEEYIIHDMSETAQDPLGNEKTFYRGSCGIFPIPIPYYEVRVNPEEGYAKEKYVSHVSRVDLGYSIPFNKENVDKLMKYTDRNTAYAIQKEDYKTGIKITCEDARSWTTGKAEELLRFGHSPLSSYESQIAADEKIGKYQDHILQNSSKVYR